MKRGTKDKDIKSNEIGGWAHEKKKKSTNTTRTINSSYNNAWLDIKFCPRLTRHVQSTTVYPLYAFWRLYEQSWKINLNTNVICWKNSENHYAGSHCQHFVQKQMLSKDAKAFSKTEESWSLKASVIFSAFQYRYVRTKLQFTSLVSQYFCSLQLIPAAEGGFIETSKPQR